MTLTKAELADLLFEKVGLNKREAKDMVEAFFEEIRGALERGERDSPQRTPGRGGAPGLSSHPRGAPPPPPPRDPLKEKGFPSGGARTRLDKARLENGRLDTAAPVEERMEAAVRNGRMTPPA